MQTDGEPPITVVEADGEPPVTVVEANGDEPPVTVVEVVAVEVLAPAGAVEVLGSSSEAVSAATSDACVCSECKKVHPQSSFSKTQWSKPVEQRRCKSCIGPPPPTKVEVKRMAREQDSQHCQDLESGCYSMAPPCCCFRCSWLQFDEQNPIYRRPNVDSLLLLLAFLWYLRVRSNGAARCCERYAAAV